MSRISDVFKDKKAFIPFITSGDPDLDFTEKCVCAMAENGADIIELGIPFSDPIAEGPVIRDASMRALRAHTTTDKIFSCIKKIRKKTQIPLILMTYANPVFVYGKNAFMKKCEEVGVDGIIIPDTPFEEKREFEPFCKKYGIDLINMISPTSSQERIEKIAKDANGFLYCVSSLGVTGMRNSFSSGLSEMISKIKSINPSIPCAIGFGVSNPKQAQDMSEISDGVIIGSAIVNIIAKSGNQALESVIEFVKSIAEAIN